MSGRIYWDNSDPTQISSFEGRFLIKPSNKSFLLVDRINGQVLITRRRTIHACKKMATHRCRALKKSDYPGGRDAPPAVDVMAELTS